MEDTGAFALVLELVTEEAAQAVAERLKIPVIGIGAGRYCDGQVLIVHDLVGLNDDELILTKTYGQTRQQWPKCSKRTVGKSKKSLPHG